MKAIKNGIERQQMRNAHIKDAASICDVLCYLEEDVCIIRPNEQWLLLLVLLIILVTFQISAAPWDEAKLAGQLDKLRWRDMFRGPAYPTVAAYAAHGSHPLVIPGENTSASIGGESTIIIDVGGQYVSEFFFTFYSHVG